MHQLLNTLYVTTEGAYLRADHETLRVEVERETKLQVPIPSHRRRRLFRRNHDEPSRDGRLRGRWAVRRAVGSERTDSRRVLKAR